MASGGGATQVNYDPAADLPLLQGDSYFATAQVTLPVVSGNWFVMVKADGNDRQDEANNVDGVPIAISLPDTTTVLTEGQVAVVGSRLFYNNSVWDKITIWKTGPRHQRRTASRCVQVPARADRIAYSRCRPAPNFVKNFTMLEVRSPKKRSFVVNPLVESIISSDNGPK